MNIFELLMQKEQVGGVRLERSRIFTCKRLLKGYCHENTLFVAGLRRAEARQQRHSVAVDTRCVDRTQDS